MLWWWRRWRLRERERERERQLESETLQTYIKQERITTNARERERERDRERQRQREREREGERESYLVVRSTNITYLYHFLSFDLVFTDSFLPILYSLQHLSNRINRYMSLRDILYINKTIEATS